MPTNNFKVLQAVWARLNSQLSQDVYSHVPQGASYPYVAISDISGLVNDTKTSDSQEYTMQIHSWDKNKSSFESVMNMQDAIRTALHNESENVIITGFKVVQSRIEFENTMQEGASGIGGDHYYHGVQRLRITVQDV